MAWWAVTPTTDNVPTGTIKNRDGALVVDHAGASSARRPCRAARAPRARSRSSDRRRRDYQRDPCKLPHQNDRLILLVDVVLVVGVLVILVRTWKPSEELALDGTST